MKPILTICALLALTACSQPSDQASDNAPLQTTTTTETTTVSSAVPEAAPVSGPITPTKTDAPAGAYKLDPTHASLTFRVNHLGFSNYTARFTSFNAELQFDPVNPTASSVTATIDPNSIALNAPPPGFADALRGVQWLDTAQFPEMTFRSTTVELTAPNAARVTGDFTLHGQTHPVSLNVTFNGGYPGMAMDPNARIGLSAHGSFKRSQFGMGFGVPAPGSNMGVGDDVDIAIEAELIGPALTEAAPAQPAQ